MPATHASIRAWKQWCCTCREPLPGWWHVECRRCLRPILAELERILATRP